MTELLSRCRAAARRFEIELALLCVLVGALYFLRLGDLPLRGEESRWTQVAREMVTGGDWVVPRQQGWPFLSRPPLLSWLIGLSALVRGEFDAVAVRLPAALSILLITLLVYGYSRRFLDRLGAFTAACACATFSQTLQLGRLAESESCFMFLVSGALLVWHWGYSQGWPPVATWLAGYGLAALGALTKGPQAPVYFAGCVGVYLLWRRDWRWLFGGAHVLGLLGFLAIVGAWQLPFAGELGWAGVRAIWGGDSADRWLHQRPLAEKALRLVNYPLEVAACLLPWSLLLLAYLDRSFRQTLGAARPMAGFLATCLLVTFPTCWWTPGTMTRYFLPMYPCLAPLIGLVVQRLAAGQVAAWLYKTQRLLLPLLAGFMAVIAGLVLLISFLPVRGLLQEWAQPAWFALGYGLVTIGLAVAVWRTCGRADATALRTAVLAVVCFLGLTYNGPILNALLNRSERAGESVARLKTLLPPGQRLVSFGSVHHLFAFYYVEPIERRPEPVDAAACEDVVYFCLDVFGGSRPQLPFAWQEVGFVSMDRNRHDRPNERVVVGRRLHPMQPVDPE